MKEEKTKVIIAGSSLDYIGFKTAQLFAQTTEDMQVLMRKIIQNHIEIFHLIFLMIGGKQKKLENY